MSSSEEYLDSLLDSILGGGKPDEEGNTAFEPEGGDNLMVSSDGGKAMSPDEIEEMLVSMGTLGGAEEEIQEQTNSEAEDMEAMLAFMNKHNAAASASGNTEPLLSDQGMEESAVLDDFALEETGTEGVSDGLNDLSLDDLDLGESGGDGAASDELSLDDISLDDLGMEEGVTSDGLALGETDFREGMPDGLDDLSLDDLDLGESGDDGVALDELSLDDLSLDDLGMEESAALDDFVLEETDAGEDILDGLDNLSLDELDLGESSSDGATLDDLSLDDLSIEESAVSDDLSLDDLALEESESMDGEMDGLMSEEDIDRLLNGDLSGGEGSVDDFALEETGESDEDLSALLAGMDHDDDLSEINDLLEGVGQGVSTDEDMLAMLEGVDDNGDGGFDFFENDEAAREAEGIRELTPEEIAAREGEEKPKKEKKKRKKLFGKKKKESAEETTVEEPMDELEALLGESTEQEPMAEEEEKKPSFFAKLMNFLLETDEEDEDPLAAEILADNAGEMGMVTDENRAILEELKEEDKKGKGKKKKDKKKGKKGKEGEGEEAVEGEEEESKKAKKKKRKEKKKKEEEEVDLFAPPEKKLSKKKVITVFVFCGTIAACIVLLCSFLPNYMEKREAHVAYDHQDYVEVFDLLYGKKLNEEEEMIFQRSSLVLQMNRKLTSYENYVNLNMRLEALNALISGVARYQEILSDAETYNVVGEVSDIYVQILEKLSSDFGVSESDALDIIASEDDVTYSQRLEAIVSGAFYGEDVPVGRQDVLPEEEEIIERIDGVEADFDEGQQEDMLLDEEMGETSPAEENVGEDMTADENMDEGAE